MQTKVGVIKQISGLVVAIDQNGLSRVLKVGDALYLGEVIKGNESVKLDNSVMANSDNTVADVSDLQKALLDGKDLTKFRRNCSWRW